MSSPPVHISGPTDPLAFVGIPIRARPDYATHACPVCHGHGEWNNEMFEGGRVIVKMCRYCGGYGWLTADNRHERQDIVMVNGHPHWVMTLEPAEIEDTPSVPL